MCKDLVSRGGVGKKASTTPLINHLKRKHNSEHEEYLTATKVKREETNKVEATTSRKQQMIQQTIDCHKKNGTLIASKPRKFIN